MQPILENGNEKINDPTNVAGTNFMVPGRMTMLNEEEVIKLEQEQKDAKELIKHIFAITKQDERKI